MKKICSLVVLVVLAVALPCSLYAWGKKGHGIVAEVAFSLLDSNIKDSVKKYLDTMSIEYASIWMDEMRSDPKYNYMKTWHYVDFEKGQQYTETKEDNIINALNKAIDNLEHRDALSNEAIKTNLLIVFHMVGDLHMPLHVGYAEDKGGNTIQVKYINNQTNLHRVWDTEIIESENITTNDCLAKLNMFSKTEIEGFEKINVENWINEPRSLLNNVYEFKDNTIDQAYINKNKEIIEEQLAIAGVRLSAVLKKVFKS